MCIRDRDAVVAVIVGVDLRLEPAASDESFLDLANLFFRHQQIDIGKDPAARRRQPGQEIAGALEQDQWQVDPLDVYKRQANFLYSDAGIFSVF